MAQKPRLAARIQYNVVSRPKTRNSSNQVNAALWSLVRRAPSTVYQPSSAATKQKCGYPPVEKLVRGNACANQKTERCGKGKCLKSDWGEYSRDRQLQRKNKRSGVVWRSCRFPETISQHLRIDHLLALRHPAV